VGDGVNALLDVGQLLLMAAGLALLYRFVPNTPVKWQHALAGGLFAALGLGLTRWGLGLYLSRVPSYSAIYGTFATLPILLLWINLSWLIVLLGAVIAAYLPSLLTGVARRGGGPGWNFQLAAELLQALAAVREGATRGLTLPQLAARLRVDTLQLSPVLTALRELDWVGELGTRSENEQPRHVLLAEPHRLPLRPLVEKLLLQPDPALAGWWADRRLADMTAADLLAPAPEKIQAK
jgi:membrane protein